jgi:lactate permease
MTLLLQILPLAALVVLLAAGRTGPLVSCLIAMALCLPAALADGLDAGGVTDFLAGSAAQGLWLAIVPVGIIAGGLVFHGAVSARGAAGETPIAARDVGDTLFTAAFLLGPFTETVTGFGVGTVFAIGLLRRAGIGGTQAALIGLVAQMLIPWGGLGPGTSVGAALAGISPQDLATRSAWQAGAVLLLLLPCFWVWSARAGHAVPWPTRLGQIGWVAATAALLIGGHYVAPWELCGLLATGTVLAVRLLAADPPQTWAAWRRVAGGGAPYLLLAAALMAQRLWVDAPSWHPFPALPALGLNHAMVAIWAVALLLLLLRPQRLTALADAARRARRPALALLGFVVLSRFLSGAGIPTALAHALAGGFGTAAPFAAPLLAGFAGFFGGTNVASNSAMMPLQAELGRIAGLDPIVLPAVQNGTPFLLVSAQLTAIAAGLAGGGATPASIWRLSWPIALIALAVGVASVAIG